MSKKGAAMGRNPIDLAETATLADFHGSSMKAAQTDAGDDPS
jgi:hypothetical protein